MEHVQNPASTLIPTKFSAFCVIMLCLCPANLRGQDGWFWQNPLPQGNTITDIQAFDQNTARGVGYNGTIVDTYDGGETWEVRNIGDFFIWSAHFINPNIGWIVSSNEFVAKTTDGGVTWIDQSVGFSMTWNSVFFIDSLTGWIVGIQEGGGAYAGRTTDGGDTWNLVWGGGSTDVFFVNPMMGWTVSWDGSIRHSSDGGVT